MLDVGEDADVKEDNGGGAGFPIRWFRRRRARGRRERRKKKEWGVKGRVTPAPLFISLGGGSGALPLCPRPRPFLPITPRGGTSWGGGSYNRATRPVMAMMGDSNYTANRHLM
jgi:hypothetical protein